MFAGAGHTLLRLGLNGGNTRSLGSGIFAAVGSKTAVTMVPGGVSGRSGLQAPKISSTAAAERREDASSSRMQSLLIFGRSIGTALDDKRHAQDQNERTGDAGLPLDV